MSIYGESGSIMQICGRGVLVVTFVFFHANLVVT